LGKKKKEKKHVKNKKRRNKGEKKTATVKNLRVLEYLLIYIYISTSTYQKNKILKKLIWNKKILNFFKNIFKIQKQTYS